MLQQAGAYMRPGYLRPVYDLESGNTQRSREDLTNFALDFANRIYEVKGIYPLVYINSLMNVAVALNQGSYAAAHNIESGGEWWMEIRKGR